MYTITFRRPTTAVHPSTPASQIPHKTQRYIQPDTLPQRAHPQHQVLAYRYRPGPGARAHHVGGVARVHEEGGAVGSRVVLAVLVGLGLC